jgi:predicted N-acyltransferase
VLELTVHPGIDSFTRAEWDGLLGEGPPFLSWEFLRALEVTGCVGADKGWAPAHLGLRSQGQLLAVAPAYIKGNSEGEFVFDHSWAQFSYERLAAPYYPKLVLASPFTPATGPRLLCAPGTEQAKLFRALHQGMAQLCQQHDLSSAHVLFPDPEQATSLGETGLLLRYGIQYHWRNIGYATFNDFLARYPSKRRNQILRERRELQAQNLELVVAAGSELSPAQIDHVYDFYLATIEKHVWGRRYLNRDFFTEICSRLGERILVVFARDKSNGRYVAGAFNLLGKQRMYGRYWGARQELRYLHFNVCYYQGIEECIRRGLEVFEPGAGGEHKLARGFEPVITYSAHHLEHRTLRSAVARFLEHERSAVQQQLELEPKVLRQV